MVATFNNYQELADHALMIEGKQQQIENSKRKYGQGKYNSGAQQKPHFTPRPGGHFQHTHGGGSSHNHHGTKNGNGNGGNIDCATKSILLTTPEGRRIKYVSRHVPKRTQVNSL